MESPNLGGIRLNLRQGYIVCDSCQGTFSCVRGARLPVSAIAQKALLRPGCEFDRKKVQKLRCGRCGASCPAAFPLISRMHGCFAVEIEHHELPDMP